MPRSYEGSATALQEGPGGSVLGEIRSASQPITIFPQSEACLPPWLHYHLFIQSMASLGQLEGAFLWWYGQRLMPGVTWQPTRGASLPFEIVAIGESYAGSAPMAAAYADSSTSPDKHAAADDAIVDHFSSLLQAAFNLGAGEQFEDGMQTEFSEALTKCIVAGRSSAVDALRRLLDQGYAGHEVGGEALRWLGCVDQPATRDVRRLALEHYLQSDSAYLRHGAAIGLSEMDDPAALPAIEIAASRGTSPLMLKRLKQLQEQLEATRSCHTSPG